jgi:hypothetical protein
MVDKVYRCFLKAKGHLLNHGESLVVRSKSVVNLNGYPVVPPKHGTKEAD